MEALSRVNASLLAGYNEMVMKDIWLINKAKK